jgi:hypothetical protein
VALLKFAAVLLAAVFLFGCGKAERAEAVKLTKVLTEKQANFNKGNSMESDLIASARAWSGGIVANGAGHGAELKQNAAVATELAKSAVAASAELGQVRQAVYGLSLEEEYPQSVRLNLITVLTKRQRDLQDIRALLEQSAPQFLDYQNSKTYAGDQYPGGIGKLNAMIGSYSTPEDTVGTAIADLKAKYKLTGNEP